MKTLVVLTALIAAVVAAPSLLQDRREDIQPQQETPETFKRDKKSVLEGHHTGQIPGAAAVVEPSNPELALTARTFGHKSKPIIIKKKVGYHIYRDSGEEKADSRESCQKELKVKLCDEANSAKSMRANDNMSEGNMHRNIQMAKEAVEHLQRDIKEIEENSEAKRMTDNQGKATSNAEIREDIEDAKDVLDQIHRNFGLESMSLHKTISKDAESHHDIHLTIAKTEEERMAQWKEALENIQRNVEIVRNIEDSFKPANHDTDQFAENSHNMEHENDQSHMRTVEKSTFNENIDNLQFKAKDSESSEKHSHEDMKMAASHLDETKHTEHLAQKSGVENKGESHHMLRNPVESGVETELFNMDTKHDLHDGSRFDSSALKSMSLKAEEEKHVTDEDTNINNSETDLKSFSDLHTFKESEATANMWNHNTADKNTEQEIASEHLDHLDTQKRDNIHSDELEKTTHKTLSTVENHEVKEKEAFQMKENVDHENHVPKLKSSDSSETHNLALTQKETSMMAKSMDQDAHASQQVQTIEHNVPHHLMNTAMKSADLHINEPHLTGPVDTRWAQDQNMRWAQDKHMMHFDENVPMKAAEEKHLHLNEPSRNMHFIDQPHRLSNSMKSAGQHPMHFDASKSHLFPSQTPLHSHAQRTHEALTMHGKHMVDSAMQSSMDMREAIANFDQNNQAWKQQQEPLRAMYASRTAYPASSAGISGSSGSTGALGVFPNAHTGGCGIPLLLSCSPSVVSGSLAKAQPAPSYTAPASNYAASGPSYSAPAYRTEDEFFHTKRDVTNTIENQISKIQRNPATNTKTLPLNKSQ